MNTNSQLADDLLDVIRCAKSELAAIQQKPGEMGNKPQIARSPNESNPATVPSPLLYAWEIVLMIPDHRDKKKHTRCSMIIAAPSIEAVWDYLAIDLADKATEIESIVRLGPIVAVLERPVGSQQP